MKYKFLAICIIIVTAIVTIRQLYYKSNNTNIEWIKDLNYKENQVHDISFGLFNPCPSIPISINDKEIKLLFDTGNADGLLLTTAIKGKVDYIITGKSTALNADGTYRGDGNTILLKNISVFGDEYSNVNTTLTNWRMYGFFKTNGTIGMEYFNNKIVTLDYKNKKIAVSDNAIDYSKFPKNKYTIVPLISPILSNEKDLLFFQGEVNGEKSTIYLDTGSTRSFVNLEGNKVKNAELKLGDKEYKLKDLKLGEIGLKDKFEYPLRLAINSDLLKLNHFVITIDKIKNNLIIYQN